MSDDIALVLIKRIEALEEQVAELKAPKLPALSPCNYIANGFCTKCGQTHEGPTAPLEWPAIDLGMVEGRK